MNKLKRLGFLAKRSKCNTFIFRAYQNLTPSAVKDQFASSQADRGYAVATSCQQVGYGREHLQGTLISARNMALRVKPYSGFSGNILAQKKYTLVLSCQYSHSANDNPDLSRNFFVRLWDIDKKRRRCEEKKRQKVARRAHPHYSSKASSQAAPGGWDSDEVKPLLKQPPTSQSITGPLKPSSTEEAQVAPLLARSNLLVTRDIEWANLVAGFEQENRYLVVDVCYPQSPVGYIREQSNILARQFLRTRRPFVAYILDGLGNELFTIRRPFWWINSSIYAEINGKEIGVVHRRWHLWKRIYDLYLGNKQFAVVDNPGFWVWTFTLKDIDGAVLAQIDRNWRGFGFEIFTDAGQYVIRFGTHDSSPFPGIEELEVKRPLNLSERAIVVALAVSLDNDYFSRHGGWGLPFMIVGE